MGVSKGVMKKIVLILISFIYVIALAGCSGNSSPNTSSAESPVNTSVPFSAPSESKAPEQSQDGDTMPTVIIQIGDKNFTAFMHDNELARTIVQAMPFTLEMDDFASLPCTPIDTFAPPPAGNH